MFAGIKIEYSVDYVYTQNGVAESLIKCFQLIATIVNKQKDSCYNMGACYVACNNNGAHKAN